MDKENNINLPGISKIHGGEKVVLLENSIVNKAVGDLTTIIITTILAIANTTITKKDFKGDVIFISLPMWETHKSFNKVVLGDNQSKSSKTNRIHRKAKGHLRKCFRSSENL